MNRPLQFSRSRRPFADFDPALIDERNRTCARRSDAAHLAWLEREINRHLREQRKAQKRAQPVTWQQWLFAAVAGLFMSGMLLAVMGVW
jgi:hypothetical protein